MEELISIPQNISMDDLKEIRRSLDKLADNLKTTKKSIKAEEARQTATKSTASSIAASPPGSIHETEPGSSDSEDDFSAVKRPRRVKANTTNQATTLQTSNKFEALSDMEVESDQTLIDLKSSPRRRKKSVKSKELTTAISTDRNSAPTSSAPRPPTAGPSDTRSKTATAATKDTGPKTTDRLPKPEKMPAIVIHQKNAWTTISSIMTANGIKFTEAVNKFDGIHVTTAEPDDHRNLHKLLTNRKIEHHVYKLQSDKPLRVVIRGLPIDISCEEIKEELTDLGFPVQEISKLKTGREVRRESPLVYVLLKRNNAGMGIYNLKRLCYLRVTVEAKRKQENLVRQCFNCQLFGHTQSSCFAIPKCNRCAGDHGKDQCTLPREQETCMNCRRAGQVGNHAASYDGCPFHPKQRQSRVPQAGLTPPGQQANPWCAPGQNRNQQQANQQATPGPSTQPQAAPNPERKSGKPYSETANKSPILELINMFVSNWWVKICQFLTEITTASSPAEAIIIIGQKITTLLAHIK